MDKETLSARARKRIEDGKKLERHRMYEKGYMPIPTAEERREMMKEYVHMSTVRDWAKYLIGAEQYLNRGDVGRALESVTYVRQMMKKHLNQ